MKIIAIITSYNEQRYVRACLEHYLKNGIHVYLLDNESTDDTIEIAKDYLGQNLIQIETVPRHGIQDWKKMLMHKERIADSLDADWYMHADIDEIRESPDPNQTLRDAIIEVDREGYNAINFMEYTFIPTQEQPDHDSPDFQTTMHWYYPFAPRHPHRLNLWKKQPRKWPGIEKTIKEMYFNHRLPASIDLVSSGGHVVKFNGINPYPQDFVMKHYMLLSLEHAISKYVKIEHNEKEENWHGWRATAGIEDFILPSQSQLRYYEPTSPMDASAPFKKHLIIKPNNND